MEPSLTEGQLEAVGFLDADLQTLFADTNEQIMVGRTPVPAAFFDTIEKSPLTEEQARAVVCFDNRVQVLAAAGSGKTSVMVARAAYAVTRGFISPDRILLLAFNKAAATEMQERVAARFAAAGLNSSGLRASTFHSFGLEVIGQATGEKPRLASGWTRGAISGWSCALSMSCGTPRSPSGTAGTSTGCCFQRPDRPHRERTGRLRQSDQPDRLPDIRRRGRQEPWRMPDRQLPLPQWGQLRVRAALRRSTSRTPRTRSTTRTSTIRTSVSGTSTGRSTGTAGLPPRSTTMQRAWGGSAATHQHATTLVETTWADVMFGDGLTKLKDELTRLGLTFDWNPDRPISDQWAKPMKHEDLARLADVHDPCEVELVDPGRPRTSARV